MNFTTTSTIGIDTVIQSIQNELYSNLIVSWSENIDGYGRVYINKKQNENIAQYFIDEKDYKDVYVNDEKDAQFFFLTDENSTTEDEYVYKNKTKVVFIVNLKKVFDSGRVDSKARVNVINFLRNIAYGRFQIEGYDTGVDNVFRGLNTDKLKKADLQPFHVFSINIDLNYYLDEVCLGSSSTGSESEINDNDNGNGESNITVPTIRVQSQYFLTIDSPISFSIDIDNNPDSVTITNLPNGLSFNESTLTVSGIYNGPVQDFSCNITASNSEGQSNREITLSMTNETLDDLLAPYNLIDANIDLDNGNFILLWDIRDYNGTIESFEIYRQGELVATKIYDGPQNPFDISDKYNFIGEPFGRFEYTVRAKDILGNYSPFSDVLEVALIPSLSYIQNESVTKTKPSLNDAVAYYKMDSLVNGVIVDELGNNNLISENTGLVLRETGNYVVNFESDNTLKAYSSVDSSDFSFTDGNSDKPFSVSFWFKKISTSELDDNGVFDLLIGKDKEWSISISNAYQEDDKVKVTANFSDEDYVGQNFSSKTVRYPSTTQWLNTLNKNEWHHVVVTSNGLVADGEKGGMQIFVNNTYNGMEGAINETFPKRYYSMRLTDGLFKIGGDNIREDRVSKFQIDEVVIFNKQLSKDEINYLYNNGSPIDLS